MEAVIGDWRQDLGDGLVMRAAVPEDAERLARFNTETLLEPGENPDFLQSWTTDLVTRPNPALTVDDIIVVEEPTTGRIASSTLYFSEKWSYEGITIPAGRPELVSTHPDFRNRGLVRRQFEVMHRWGRRKRHLVQGITGIPWYYRQFGYDMALEMPAPRSAPLAAMPRRKRGDRRALTLRVATRRDMAFVTRLVRRSRPRSLFSAKVNEGEIAYLLFDRARGSDALLRTFVVEQERQPVGFAVAEASFLRKAVRIHAVEFVRPGLWRACLEELLTELSTWAHRQKTQTRPLESIVFNVPDSHPVLPLLGARFAQPARRYSWYVRVPDLPALLRRIGPGLAARLKGTVHEGLTEDVLISAYRTGWVLQFERGQLSNVLVVRFPDRRSAAAHFPDMTFHQLLFGRRSFAELNEMQVDCFARSAADSHLMDTLFPKRASDLTFALE